MTDTETPQQFTTNQQHPPPLMTYYSIKYTAPCKYWQKGNRLETLAFTHLSITKKFYKVFMWIGHYYCDLILPRHETTSTVKVKIEAHDLN